MSEIQPGTPAVPPSAPGPTPPRRSGRTKAILLGCAGLIGLFVLLAIIGALVGGGTKTTTSTASPRPSGTASPSPEAAASPSPAPTTAPAPVVPPVVAPVVPPPAAPPPVSLAVHIKASTYGHVAATTSPGATCTASATLPSGNLSTAAGLQVAQTAAAGGTVDWTYRITSRTGKGTGSHTVSCQLNGQSANDSAPFVV